MDTDILKKSVTRDDHPTSPYQSGVLHFILGSPTQRNGLPVYWSPARDYFLRMILYTEFHDFWSGAIGIAVTKMSSLAWDLESSQPRVRNDFQELLLAADNNQSWTSFLARHLQDFLGTDNGAFIEVVHATQGYGSRILGLMHLDSWRCTRTGDPDIPVLYRDTLGRIHEMRPHQVMCFADMPSPAETYHGVGLCATSRAWGAIRKMEAIERYIYEKVSGDRALALHFIGGILPKDISDGIQAAKESNEARGNTSYMGAITIPVPSDQPLNLITIPFAELPDGFDYDKQINNAILVYANSLGLDVQDLQPLTGRALGTGAQSQVLEDKSRGKGLAAWRQQWTHMTNEYVLPDTVTFAFSEKDMRDQQRQADINKTYADTVTGLVTSNILTTQQAQQILADNDVIPQEFVPEDTTPVEAISDTEKPQVEADAQEQVSEMPTETPPPTEQTPTEKEAQTSANPFAIDSHDWDTTQQTNAKEFNEADHPRDEAGRFTTGSDGGSRTQNKPSRKTRVACAPPYRDFNDTQVDTNAETAIEGDLFASGKAPQFGASEGYRYPKEVQVQEKANRVKELSADANVSEDFANVYIHQWAETSNDNNYTSLHLQKLAADEFGAELSPWQAEQYRTRTVTRLFGADEGTEAFKTNEAQSRATINAVYDRTQALFNRSGVKSVTVFRGIDTSQMPAAKFKVGEYVNTTGNALESWALHPGIARKFGNVTLKMVVPVERVFSTARTGIGCLNEHEVVIIGNQPGIQDQARVIRSSE